MILHIQIVDSIFLRNAESLVYHFHVVCQELYILNDVKKSLQFGYVMEEL